MSTIISPQRHIIIGEGIITKQLKYTNNVFIVVPPSLKDDVNKYLHDCGCQLMYRNSHIMQSMCPGINNSYIVTIATTLL